MHDKKKPSFAFLVLMYNHQNYILEHLESIKYLVQKYAAEIDVDLIVNDDCSKDQTRSLVDAWLELNAFLFRHIKKIYNPKNIGTCSSVNNMLDHMVANRCKLTAGDDVYSFENIFDLTQHENDVAMVSGRPLYLVGDDLALDKKANFLVTATQVIYQNDLLLHRFKHWSYTNAPSLLYATECLLHPEVRAYLRGFDVVEDWPLQIGIARQFPRKKFKLDDHIWVYYRRTIGSAYIVANKRFIHDKEQIYKNLIKFEINWLERLRIKSRLFCFGVEGKLLKWILNIDAYFFIASVIFKIREILSFKYNVKLIKHREHYYWIKIISARFLMDNKIKIN